MARPVVYLDHNATTPVCDAARLAVSDALSLTGNPSSVHRPGSQARQVVECARRQVLRLVGEPDAEVIFTSGGTEANNLVLSGFDLPIFASAIEHDSVLAPTRSRNRRAMPIPARRTGVVDLEALDDALAKASGPVLVSLMLANNETGVIQPISEAARLTHRRGGMLHCDAVQGPGKIAVDMDQLGVDLMTLSAHKFGGPMGVGALIVRSGIDIRPLLTGGGQEGYKRAGTHNLPGIAGFGAAAAAAGTMAPHIEDLRDSLERHCTVQGALVLGGDGPRLPNTSCLTMPAVASETQIMALDLEGIAVSAGSACSSGKVGPSHVLAAMDVPPEVANTAIRVSLGSSTSQADIDRFLQAWTNVNERAGAPAKTRLAS